MRLFVAGSAFLGYGLAVDEAADVGSATEALSQLASLLTGVVYLGLLCYPLLTGGRRAEPASSWLRGALAVLLILVSVTFLTMMEGDLSETWSLYEHAITPLVVLLDWTFVGRGQTRAAWWHPLTWTLPPLAYLVYYVSQDLTFYGSFLDPESDDFAMTVAGFLVGVVVTGYALYAVGKLRGQILSPEPQSATPPGPYGQQPPPSYGPGYAPQQPAQPYAPQPAPYQQPGQPVPQPQRPHPPQQPAYGPQAGYQPGPYQGPHPAQPGGPPPAAPHQQPQRWGGF
ncbi:hypothetical protein [Streptomyces oceani]|uniref:hypothetical protein n=1 Tax=Streptomyces oceani TaxID=1075402 RepID=UPI000871CE1A|nr:hypothetical protein [Streptomyces oceani]